jgi:hypothetical protein
MRAIMLISILAPVRPDKKGEQPRPLQERNRPIEKPLGIDSRQEASVCISEDDGTRTRNHRIDSPVL